LIVYKLPIISALWIVATVSVLVSLSADSVKPSPKVSKALAFKALLFTISPSTP